SSPIIQTPSQLSHFLKHAEKHLGPDILSDVSDQTLCDIEMSMGDVIRLKKGSATWWNGPDAKCKCSKTNADSNPSKPVTKKIAYEKRYHTGGASRSMRADDGDENGTGSSLDYYLWSSEWHLC
ncbi:hypothetical protein BU15DRAFT_32690, partial [Melanogaster broomeanus]